MATRGDEANFSTETLADFSATPGRLGRNVSRGHVARKKPRVISRGSRQSHTDPPGTLKESRDRRRVEEHGPVNAKEIVSTVLD